jgi:capsular polysaccharide biosynthesis protein
VSEQPLELRTTLRSLRRSRRLIGALGAIGLCGGIAYSVLRPQLPSATALILLPPTSTTTAGAPARDIGTQIAIATSSAVLDEAGRSVSPALKSQALKPSVKVHAVSEDVLSINVQARRASTAEALANAVANDYIKYVTASNSAVSGSALAGLQAQSAQLSKQLVTLQGQISQTQAQLAAESPTSPEGQRDTALLGSIGSEQQSVTLQLNNVSSQILQDEITTQVAAGAKILQPANAIAPVSKLRLPMTGAMGLAAGLLLGVAIALAKGHRDRRLRFRTDIARAVGSPVLASISAKRHKSTDDWRALMSRYRPSESDAWGLRRVLRHFNVDAASAESSIRVLSFADDGAAMAVGPQLASVVSSLGRAPELVVDSHPAAETLRAASATLGSPDRGADQSIDGSGDLTRSSASNLTVSVTVLERQRPDFSSDHTSAHLLAVSAGFATTDELARLALAMADAGETIDGIVVVNPDLSDHTAGEATDEGSGHLRPDDLSRPAWLKPLDLDRRAETSEPTRR